MKLKDGGELVIRNIQRNEILCMDPPFVTHLAW